MTDPRLQRIQKELSNLRRNIDHCYYVAANDSDITHIHALILGPRDTPYDSGMFEFMLDFPVEYPSKPMACKILTTNKGKTRFNPNLYSGDATYSTGLSQSSSGGKVCLSLLGTWRGTSGEQWSSAQGIGSILISILSLMGVTPYTNEPSFEKISTPKARAESDAYNRKIYHETLRISVLDRIEKSLQIPQPLISSSNSTSTPTNNSTLSLDNTSISASSSSSSLSDPRACCWGGVDLFNDVCKRSFLWFYDIYLENIEREQKLVKEGQIFTKMPFEGGKNTMDGAFHYTSLKNRLEVCRNKLLEETHQWMKLSKEWVKSETSTTYNLKMQLEQMKSSFNESEIDIQFEEKDNPFILRLTFIGQPATSYDGGMFVARMVLHNDFPNVQPRVQFLTEMFHPHINSFGIPYYRIVKENDISAHINALLDLFRNEPSPNPVQLIGLQAAKLCFGTAEEKKDYRRKVRRANERSLEADL